MKYVKHRIGCELAVGIAFLGLLIGQTAAGVINVLDHGAVGDGTTLNTASFQKAVAACVKQNGGTVLVPAGIYYTGPIQLQSNVTIRLIAFYNCKHLMIRDVVVTDAPCWTINFADCEYVDIDGIKVLNSPVVPNSDGMHCETCRNVHIANCELVCGDDAICITSVNSRKPGVCENVTVANCTLSSRSAGVRVGYGMNTIRNCVFENLVIRDTNRGLGLFVRQEGSIENVLFNNIIIQTRLYTGHWWGKGEPIHISVLPARESNGALGRIRNITFTNILAESKSGIVVWAQEPGRIEDVTLDQIRLHVRKGPLSASYGGNIDLRPAFDHQWAIFRHDLAGIFCRGAKGLTVNQADIRWDANMPEYYTYAIWCEETSRIVVDGFHGRQPGLGDGQAAIALDSVRGVIVRNSQVAEGTTTFLRHRAVTEAGLFGNNDVTKAATAIDPLPSPFALSTSISSPTAHPH